MIPFSERAADMGLTPYSGGFKYSDRYSEVLYRTIITPRFTDEVHITDNYQLPYFALFIKEAGSSDEAFRYCGVVSNVYKFMGNDVIIQKVRDSILEIGSPILQENVIYPPFFTRMRDEILISSSVNSSLVGDVVPVMIVQNTYDGTGAAKVAFGIAVNHNERYVTFGFSLGELRQVHIDSSRTSMAASISNYLQIFNESIVEMITQSFNSRITEEEMLSTLDVIEELGGKRRREAISSIISEITPLDSDGQVPLPSSWGIFLAIVRYSSFEVNLNVKRLLENAAERVLVIPTRMYEILETLNG